MVVVAGHMGHHAVAAGQLQRVEELRAAKRLAQDACLHGRGIVVHHIVGAQQHIAFAPRSEEHTSELQSHSDLVCRLLLEKKKTVGGFSGASGGGASAAFPVSSEQTAAAITYITD